MATNVRPFPPRLGTFTIVSDRRYVMDITSLGVTFDLTRIRRDRNEFIGELLVSCTLAGARTIEGTLSIADVNLSSLQARVTRAKFLADRAQTKPDQIDWVGLLEEFCQRVLKFDRQGTAAQGLRDLPALQGSEEFEIAGLPLLSKHPVIWFGDGGSAKSLLALYAAAQIAGRGDHVLYADWEFSGEDHRARLERLCAPGPMPATLWYAWCARPLVEEVERLASMIAEHQITYLICDSVAFACKGAPESAEAANDYFRALRALKVGSLNVAHITKGNEDSGAEKRPFGSIFWHNGARATWFIKRADDERDDDRIDIALLQRKANVGRRRSAALGIRFTFTDPRIAVESFTVADHQELSAKLPLWQRARAVLRQGPLEPAELAERADGTPTAIRQMVHRMSLFVRLPDGRIALSARGDDQAIF
jgi:hypothetical protein